MSSIASLWSTRYLPMTLCVSNHVDTADLEAASARARLERYAADSAYRSDAYLKRHGLVENVRRDREKSVERHTTRMAALMRTLEALRRTLRTLNGEASRAMQRGATPDDSWGTSAGTAYAHLSGVQRLSHLEGELKGLIDEIKAIGVF